MGTSECHVDNSTAEKWTPRENSREPKAPLHDLAIRLGDGKAKTRYIKNTSATAALTLGTLRGQAPSAGRKSHPQTRRAEKNEKGKPRQKAGTGKLHNKAHRNTEKTGGTQGAGGDGGGGGQTAGGRATVGGARGRTSPGDLTTITEDRGVELLELT